MADEVSIEELRANLDAILRRVFGGAHVTVTIDGQPVAELKPPPPETWVPKERLIAMIENRPADPGFFETLDELQSDTIGDHLDRIQQRYDQP